MENYMIRRNRGWLVTKPSTRNPITCRPAVVAHIVYRFRESEYIVLDVAIWFAGATLVCRAWKRHIVSLHEVPGSWIGFDNALQDRELVVNASSFRLSFVTEHYRYKDLWGWRARQGVHNILKKFNLRGKNMDP